PTMSVEVATATVADGDDPMEAAEGWQVSRTLTARGTGYAHGTRTAPGTRVRWGVVAVDPRVITLGTRIMIEGFDNVFVAEDTGGGVRGNHVAIYFPEISPALRFGVQTRRVTVLASGPEPASFCQCSGRLTGEYRRSRTF